MKTLTNIIISAAVAAVIGLIIHYASLAFGCEITIGGVIAGVIISFANTFAFLVNDK